MLSKPSSITNGGFACQWLGNIVMHILQNVINIYHVVQELRAFFTNCFLMRGWTVQTQGSCNHNASINLQLQHALETLYYLVPLINDHLDMCCSTVRSENNTFLSLKSVFIVTNIKTIEEETGVFNFCRFCISLGYVIFAFVQRCFCKKYPISRSLALKREVNLHV